MPRVYLPLLPIPVLALIVAFSACSRSAEPSTHVIPPAAPYQQPAAVAPAPAPLPTAGERVVPQPDADVPSEEDVKAFERAVLK